MSVVMSMRIKPLLSLASVSLLVMTGMVMGAVAARADQAGFTWTGQTSAADISWQSVTYGNGLFVAVSDSGSGNRVMTSGLFGGAVADPASWITIFQGLPLSAAGTCDGLDDKVVAYGTGLTGGWQRGWEPWVNTTLGANGERIGGWACIRTLINKGGLTWSIAN